MRSLTGNLKSRHFRSALLCGAAASFMLASCAAVPDRAAMLSAPPYFAVNESQAAMASTGHMNGSFGEQNGCVVFRTADDGTVVTPVFPKDETQLVTDGAEWLGLYVRGSPVGMGKVYSVRGADAGRAPAVALAAPLPSGCPTSTFVVQSVGDELAGAATPCRDVTICRWFVVD